MKYFLFVIFMQLAAGSWQKTSAQVTPPSDKPTSGNTSVDKQNIQVTTQDAFFPKGDQALFNYVLYNVKYSEEAKKKYIEGSVSLSFDVMPDSTVKNVNIISDLGYGVGDGVKALLEKLKFAPAIQMGMKVKSNLMMDFPVKAH
jgi:hypothetical protein